MYFLELAIGQFSSSGCVKMWRMIPAVKGRSSLTSYSYSTEIMRNTLESFYIISPIFIYFIVSQHNNLKSLEIYVCMLSLHPHSHKSSSCVAARSLPSLYVQVVSSLSPCRYWLHTVSRYFLHWNLLLLAGSGDDFLFGDVLQQGSPVVSV